MTMDHHTSSAAPFRRPPSADGFSRRGFLRLERPLAAASC